ncbi:hypothetical protein F2981_04315 [Sinorhizobium meliloti]|nr:hypothetical protein [Sinorhizobium meliloti]
MPSLFRGPEATAWKAAEPFASASSRPRSGRSPGCPSQCASGKRQRSRRRRPHRTLCRVRSTGRCRPVPRPIARKSDGPVELVGEPRRQNLCDGKGLECRLERRFYRSEAAGDVPPMLALSISSGSKRMSSGVTAMVPSSFRGACTAPIEIAFESALGDFYGRLQGPDRSPD